ncbi:MAG TPA: hypothetical protein DDZ88_05745 [Verrucomicrobiales bacterium]|nr:hypothetical protein [Verrucomicrobiales bacterium]
MACASLMDEGRFPLCEPRFTTSRAIIKKSVKTGGFEFHKPHSLPVIGGLEGFLEFFPLHHGLKVCRHLRTDIIAAASAVESGMSRHFLQFVWWLMWVCHSQDAGGAVYTIP